MQYRKATKEHQMKNTAITYLRCCKALALAMGLSTLTAHSIPLNYFDDLQSAHEAYLENNFKLMSRKIKDALLKAPNDEALLNNVSGLLKNASLRHPLDEDAVDWQLPRDVSYLKISVIRMASDRAAYSLRVNLDGPSKEALEQFQITRYPNEVVIDKAAQLGESSYEVDSQGVPNFWFGSVLKEEAPRSGLYLIDIKIKDQPRMQGWVVLTDMVASRSPAVFTPTIGQFLNSPNPTFEFQNFRSPEFQAGEPRRLYFKVKTVNGDQVWTGLIKNPNVTLAQFGVTPDFGEGVEHLENGRYRLHVIFEERRNFGPAILARQSDTVVPFSIDVKK